MNAKTGCLKCGSVEIVTEEMRYHQGSDLPISSGLFTFLYLISVPSVFLGMLLAARGVHTAVGVALAAIASIVFIVAIVLNRMWQKADRALVQSCKSCGYSRKDGDPLPAIEPDAGLLIRSFSNGA